MAVRALGAALQGVEAIPIAVEVDLLRRLPGVCVVGLAAGAVRESAERVRSAIAGAGLDFPRKRVVVNLAPADVRKDGAAFDLPIAIGVLAADGALPSSALDEVLLVGEMSLGGVLRPVRGAVALAELARRLDKALILPEESAAQASVVPELRVFAARDLAGVVAHLRGERALPSPESAAPALGSGDADLADVRGQLVARRALEIAAAGAHHLLLQGPPGCGKSMLARRLPTILPPLSFDEALEVTRVHSAAGLLPPGVGLMRARPFRAPHHSVTVAGLVGDRTLRPGEVSLAHHGVLFLDEAPEFSRSALEVLRAPLEDGVVVLSRAEGTLTHPAAVSLVLASNPCPCGYLGSSTSCGCTEAEVRRYQRKLSGPILDRVDLHVRLEPVPAEELLSTTKAEASADVRTRVVAARRRQADRGQRVPNARLGREGLDRVAALTPAARAVLRAAVTTHQLSGRATTRLLKVARTVADLAGDDGVSEHALHEALAFRAPDPAPA